jgi:tetratricopeptide (TPR) repeat protein
MRMRMVLAIAVGVSILWIVWWFARTLRQPSSVESLVVSLRVNGGTETAIERGEPLLLEVFVAGRDATADAQIGSASTPWFRLVSLRFDDGRPFPATPTILSPARRVTLGRDRDKRPGVEEADATIARVEGRRHMFIVELGVSPTVTRELSVGAHGIRAVLDGRATSMLVTIQVTEAAASNEARRLERASRYYLRTGQHAEAREAAQVLIRNRPDDPGGRILLGDALRRMGEAPRALEEYIRALRAFKAGRSFYEDHEPLLDRIRLVELELAKAGKSRPLHASSVGEIP